MVAPESRKHAIEDRNLILTMDEKGAACVVDVVPGAKIHMAEGIQQVEQTPRMDVDARPPQKAPENEQVIEQVGHQRSSDARRTSCEGPIEQLGGVVSTDRIDILL